ncbi:MAG: DegT/DnrJ/EryC1/StrS family aminotransferase [Spirochaetales bacterium]
MDIKTFSSTIRRKEMDAVLTCMVEEKIGPGELNTRLIQKAKEFFSVNGSIALRSPSIALKHALCALNLEPQSGIMISALAPSWQYITVCELGYNPVILDVSPDAGLVDVSMIQAGIQKGGRLLILHEALGSVPNFPALLELNIPIIEDISQNAGASFEEKNVGNFGVFSILGLEQNDILTGGGGALLMAGQSRNWATIRNHTEKAAKTDFLPDINAALAFIQLKEFVRNETVRKQMHETFLRSLMQGRHKTFLQQTEHAISTAYSFPVILVDGYKEVKQYAGKKGIEITPAFENSVADIFPDMCEHCVHANSLLMRCVLFPLYPRLGNSKTEKIAKVLASLP